MKIRVFNADDHPILRKGITNLLVETNDMEWVGSAGNGEEAVQKIRTLKPDVAVLDIEMPLMTGLEAAKILINEGVSTHFVLLTLFKDEMFFNEGMKIGVKGYLLKESSEHEILECIRTTSQGKAYVNAELTQYLINANHSKDSILNDLTNHEINILKLISRQKTTAEIADMLFISPKTVSNHRTNISKKLALDGKQNGLLKWAIKNKDLLE